jgi:hypothetical protein
MITLSHRSLVLACLVCLAAGWWLSSSPSSPVGPAGPPDRPILRMIAKAAKTLLWVAVFADPPPPELPQLVKARVGDDGFRELEHRRGW